MAAPCGVSVTMLAVTRTKAGRQESSDLGHLVRDRSTAGNVVHGVGRKWIDLGNARGIGADGLVPKEEVGERSARVANQAEPDRLQCPRRWLDGRRSRPDPRCRRRRRCSGRHRSIRTSRRRGAGRLRDRAGSHPRKGRARRARSWAEARRRCQHPLPASLPGPPSTPASTTPLAETQAQKETATTRPSATSLRIDRAWRGCYYARLPSVSANGREASWFREPLHYPSRRPGGRRRPSASLRFLARL